MFLFNGYFDKEIWIDVIYQPPPDYVECDLITSPVVHAVHERKFKPKSRSPPND